MPHFTSLGNKRGARGPRPKLGTEKEDKQTRTGGFLNRLFHPFGGPGKEVKPATELLINTDENTTPASPLLNRNTPPPIKEQIKSKFGWNKKR